MYRFNRLRLSGAHFPVRRLFAPVLIVLALLSLNLGLHGRLSPKAALGDLGLPFSSDFAQSDLTQWFVIGGDWQLADGRLNQQRSDAAVSLVLVPVQVPGAGEYRVSVDLRPEADAAGAGIVFNLESPQGRQRGHVVRLEREPGGAALIGGSLDGPGSFTSQARVPIDPALLAADVRLSVRVFADRYAVEVNGASVVSDLPLRWYGAHIGLSGSGGPVSFDNVLIDVPTSAAPPAANDPAPVVSAAPPVVSAGEAGALIFATDLSTDGPGLGEWSFFSGDWAFAEGALIQRNRDDYDNGAGFVPRSFTNYVLRVRFSHRTGVGGGVLFNMPQPNNATGAHMARFSDDGTAVFWGYFDPQQGLIGQGAAPVPNPGNATHTLDIVSGNGVYGVRLDGASLAEGIPLLSSAGHIGLTSSLSTVVFEAVEVYELAGIVDAGGLDLAGLTALNGTWEQIAEGVQQTDTSETDFVTTTEMAGRNYTLSVQIGMPSEPALADAGGGVIFNMPTLDSRAGATMVRFGAGGSEIFWGAYDEQGVFIGQGAATLELQPGTSRRLELRVRPGSFDLLVDGVLIGEQLPLRGEGSWIGLISYRGPVEFTRLQLSWGGAQ